MGHAATIQERSGQEERRRDTGALQKRRNDVIYLTEPIVEGQVNAGPWQRALSVQCIDNIAQRYRFKVAGEEFQIRLKLRDGSEPVEIAYMGHILVAHHVVKGNHKGHAGERAHPLHRYPGCSLRQKT
jgi:hypothetical protein